MSNQSDFYPGHLHQPAKPMHDLLNPNLTSWGLNHMPDFQITPMTTAQALAKLKEAFENDPSYAWSWHCNIAMAAKDEGASMAIANRIADRFLSALFGQKARYPEDIKNVVNDAAKKAAAEAGTAS